MFVNKHFLFIIKHYTIEVRVFYELVAKVLNYEIVLSLNSSHGIMFHFGLILLGKV